MVMGLEMRACFALVEADKQRFVTLRRSGVATLPRKMENPREVGFNGRARGLVLFDLFFPFQQKPN